MTTNLKVQKLLATLNPILMIIMNASVIAIIMIGGFQVEAKAMQVGEVMAAVTYITQILMSVMMVGMMFQQVSRSAASMKRVNEVLSTNPVISDGHKSADSDNSGTVEFRNVGFSYPGSSGKPVLSGIDLKAEKGQMIAILGSTGCGKTSLVNLVPRFYDATEGDVLVDGVNVKDYDVDTLRSKIGVVLQKSELFSGTVAENIRWGCETATDEEVKTAAKIAQAEEFIDGFNDGYDTMISEKGASLSGGQKQRVAIAGVMAMEPKCIVLDEPTAMLDPNGRKEVLHAAHELNRKKGVTILLITHYMEEVVDADYVYVMDKGHVVMQGTPREIFSQVGTLKEHRLDVPQITLLADLLRQSGLDIPLGVLTREELVDAIMKIAG